MGKIKQWLNYKFASRCTTCGLKFADEDMVAGKGMLEQECITCHKKKLERDAKPLEPVKLFGGKKR